ncbi:hypothetical protein X975_05237, partial [Stegodyphus mimosarum]
KILPQSKEVDDGRMFSCSRHQIGAHIFLGNIHFLARV